MDKVEIVLNDRELLLNVLRKVSINDLTNEISERKEVTALFQDGSKVFMVRSSHAAEQKPVA